MDKYIIGATLKDIFSIATSLRDNFSVTASANIIITVIDMANYDTRGETQYATAGQTVFIWTARLVSHPNIKVGGMAVEEDDALNPWSRTGQYEITFVNEQDEGTKVSCKNL